MKIRLYSLLLLLLGLLITMVVLYVKGFQEEAKFGLSCLTAVSVVFAVLMALYGNALKQAIEPIRLSIGIPETTNNVFDAILWEGRPNKVYCHHLSVKNRTPHHVVENCRVWLVALLDERDGGMFEERFRFAVPRLMEWAPCEYSKDKRTFSDCQIFDFGLTFVEKGDFQLRTYQDQGGNFNGNCRSGQSRRYVFHITADNYVTDNRFTVEVRSLRCTPDPSWPHQWKTDVKIIS